MFVNVWFFSRMIRGVKDFSPFISIYGRTTLLKTKTMCTVFSFCTKSLNFVVGDCLVLETHFAQEIWNFFREFGNFFSLLMISYQFTLANTNIKSAADGFFVERVQKKSFLFNSPISPPPTHCKWIECFLCTIFFTVIAARGEKLSVH